MSLILDVIGIAQQGNVLTEHSGRQIVESQKSEFEACSVQNSFLIVDPNDGTRAAIPLSMVSRLEEILPENMERNGHREVVQYRGQIMPLVSLAEYGQVEPVDGRLSLVVYNHNGRNVGIVVGRIIDIVNHSAVTTNDEDSQTQVIAGKVTRIIDLAHLAATAV